MDYIKEFHIQHGYVVKVELLDTQSKYGCKVEFPANTFMKLLPVQKTYLLYDNPYAIELLVNYDDETTRRTIEVLATNIRLLVIQDIFLTAHKRKISKDLIIVSGSKTLFDMLEIPQTEAERKLETELCLQFRELLAGNVAASDIEGYEQVLSCFENGGL